MTGAPRSAVIRVGEADPRELGARREWVAPSDPREARPLHDPLQWELFDDDDDNLSISVLDVDSREVWLATAAVGALPLAAHLPALARRARRGRLASWRPIPAAAHVVLSDQPPTAAPPAPAAPTREVGLEVAAELVPGRRELRVTFWSSGVEPLELDQPIPVDDPRPQHALPVDRMMPRERKAVADWARME